MDEDRGGAQPAGEFARQVDGDAGRRVVGDGAPDQHDVAVVEREAQAAAGSEVGEDGGHVRLLRHGGYSNGSIGLMRGTSSGSISVKGKAGRSLSFMPKAAASTERG